MAEDMQSDEQGMDAKMDPTALVREDVISDRRVGTIRMLTPITVEGVRDETRDVLFFGEAQIMTQVGALPINFQIEAKTLAEAVEGYGEAATKGTCRNAREAARNASRSRQSDRHTGYAWFPGASGSGGQRHRNAVIC